VAEGRRPERCYADKCVVCADVRNETYVWAKPGWTVGGGIEAMLWGNWLGRVEYRFADYGSFGQILHRRRSGRERRHEGTAQHADGVARSCLPVRGTAVRRLLKAKTVGIAWRVFSSTSCTRRLVHRRLPCL
jgi:hypothetical protein